MLNMRRDSLAVARLAKRERRVCSVLFMGKIAGLMHDKAFSHYIGMDRNVYRVSA